MLFRFWTRRNSRLNLRIDSRNNAETTAKSHLNTLHTQLRPNLVVFRAEIPSPVPVRPGNRISAPQKTSAKHSTLPLKILFRSGSRKMWKLRAEKEERGVVVLCHGYCCIRSPTTSFLTATTLIYAIGAGITAAAGTRLALQLLLVKRFKLYSFQLQNPRALHCYLLSLPPCVRIG